jgi:hypothetical protein
MQPNKTGPGDVGTTTPLSWRAAIARRRYCAHKDSLNDKQGPPQALR